ncbi:hypothetical protein S40288_04241 [Stachybotrys chartarum IBT 40288]|nr:hypothetical protein S40288_04241 [Stachybotrys chartarum IBT 40288]
MDRFRSRSRSRSRSAAPRPYYRADSRSPSYSEPYVRSRSSSRASYRRRSRPAAHEEHRKTPGLLKSSIGVLASIGLATYVVHKVWPNGHDFGSHKLGAHDFGSHRRGDHSNCHKDDGDNRNTKAVAFERGDQVRRRLKDDIPDERDLARGRIRSRSSVHRGRDFVVYEDIVPAREVDPRRHRDMEAVGFERHRRPADDRRWEAPTQPDEKDYRRHIDPSHQYETQPRR